MSDAIARLAMRRVIAASYDIETQLRSVQGGQPIVVMLHQARAEAMEALTRLATIQRAEEADLPAIRALQTTVARYDSLVEWLRTIVNSGFDYEHEITEQDRNEMLDLLLRTPEGEAEAVGLGLIADPSTTPE